MAKVQTCILACLLNIESSTSRQHKPTQSSKLAQTWSFSAQYHPTPDKENGRSKCACLCSKGEGPKVSKPPKHALNAFNFKKSRCTSQSDSLILRRTVSADASHWSRKSQMRKGSQWDCGVRTQNANQMPLCIGCLFVDPTGKIRIQNIMTWTCALETQKPANHLGSALDHIRNK